MSNKKIPKSIQKKLAETKRQDINLEMEQILKDMFKEMDKIFIKNFSKKCPDYYWSCICCRVWDVYDRFKKDLELEYLRKND